MFDLFFFIIFQVTGCVVYTAEFRGEYFLPIEPHPILIEIVYMNLLQAIVQDFKKNKPVSESECGTELCRYSKIEELASSSRRVRCSALHARLKISGSDE